MFLRMASWRSFVFLLYCHCHQIQAVGAAGTLVHGFFGDMFRKVMCAMPRGIVTRNQLHSQLAPPLDACMRDLGPYQFGSSGSFPHILLLDMFPVVFQSPEPIIRKPLVGGSVEIWGPPYMNTLTGHRAGPSRITLYKVCGGKLHLQAPLHEDLGSSTANGNEAVRPVSASRQHGGGSFTSVLCWFYLYTCTTRTPTLESVGPLRFKFQQATTQTLTFPGVLNAPRSLSFIAVDMEVVRCREVEQLFEQVSWVNVN
ncbi:hypothetical protein F5148DRAFT_1147542 [Russula earlei]|uniref:Uncharacterized protein n=1 Tax=Russula earlei TaxID=71964 RepID=A0ACC0UG01_9AGAM|nr:hypothetical protein F5148DRAFT_1147542 [Russula earlei]